jgi:cupin fold WbuC family metalloprotein
LKEELNYSLQKKESDEVYNSNENYFSLDKIDIDKLIQLAKSNERQRVRFCTHSNHQELVHQMFIVHPKGAYVRPHKHVHKSESMFVIDGIADYLTFSNSGSINKIISLGDYRSGKAFYQNTAEDMFHTLVIQSEWLVFFEITKGPFNKKDTIFAKWSPVEKDTLKSKIYLNDLRLKISKKDIV